MFLAPAELQPDKTLEPVVSHLVSAKYAAQVLSVSEGTIWNLAKAGHIATCKVTDTSTRFWLDDVLAYAKSRTRRAYGSGKAEAE